MDDEGELDRLRRLEDLLVEGLPALLREVRDRLDDDWPDYADFLDNDGGVLEAAAMFVRRLSESAADSEGGCVAQPGDETMRLVFEQVGRRQMQLGNDLTRLLTAFQLGTRVAWRHVSDTALEVELQPDTFAALADSVFASVNRLSNAAAHGYLVEQIEAATARERSREALAQRLLSGRASPQAVEEAALRAGWTVPMTACVVLLPGDADAALARLDVGWLPTPGRADRSERRGAIIPDPDGPGRRRRLAQRLRHTGAVVGPTVALAALPRSIEIAEVAVDLRDRGLLSDDPVFAADHLDVLVVHRDHTLIEAVRRQALSPLDPLSEGSRDRMVQTLESWLRCMGDRQQMAEDLRVHPQTVRYRMGKLQQAYGDGLDSPVVRRRLFLALEWGVG